MTRPRPLRTARSPQPWKAAYLPHSAHLWYHPHRQAAHGNHDGVTSSWSEPPQCHIVVVGATARLVRR
jgi:hypothetical protein